MSDLICVARLLLGLIFALSSLAKVSHPRRFIHGVRRFRVLPPRLSALAAITLILTEAALALSLLSGIGARIGIHVAVALFLLFTAVMVQNARRVHPLPCYCFGSDDADIHPRRTLSRLALLLTVALVVVIGSTFGESAHLSAAPTGATSLLALATLILGGWLLRLPELQELHQAPVPEFFLHSGRRVSLRELPLEPVPQSQKGRGATWRYQGFS